MISFVIPLSQVRRIKVISRVQSKTRIIIALSLFTVVNPVLVLFVELPPATLIAF